MIPILPLLAVTMLSNSMIQSSNDSEQTKQNKKQFLAKLKYKPMLVKVKVSSGGKEFKEQLINLSMIKEVIPGWTDNQGLDKDKWCHVHFIDGNSLYVETTLDGLQTIIWREQEINKK